MITTNTNCKTEMTSKTSTRMIASA